MTTPPTPFVKAATADDVGRVVVDPGGARWRVAAVAKTGTGARAHVEVTLQSAEVRSRYDRVPLARIAHDAWRWEVPKPPPPPHHVVRPPDRRCQIW